MLQNATNNETCCHKSTGIAIGNTFSEVLLLVLTEVFTSILEIPGELLHVRFANVKTAASTCHTNVYRAAESEPTHSGKYISAKRS